VPQPIYAKLKQGDFAKNIIQGVWKLISESIGILEFVKALGCEPDWTVNPRVAGINIRKVFGSFIKFGYVCC